MNKHATFKDELRELLRNIKTVEFKPVFVLVSVAVILTLSYYYASPRFFRRHLADLFAGDSLAVFYRYVYWLVSRFFAQFVLPLLLVIFVLRERPRDYGVGLGDIRMGIKLTALFLVVMLPILWFATGFRSFIIKYPQCSMVKDDWVLFLIFQLCFVLYMIGWEFIWRGYMLFGLKKKFGFYAILIQMIPFVILHFGKPAIESFAAIIAGIALGILAWRTNSFWYCVITHSSVMFFINLIAVLRYRTDVYGIGFSSLMELLGRLF